MDPSPIPASISSRPGMCHVGLATRDRPARMYAGPVTPTSDGGRRVTPLIGVTTYVVDASWGSWERRAAVLPASYFELVAAAGGRSLLLPPTSAAPDGPGAAADEAVAVLDG